MPESKKATKGEIEKFLDKPLFKKKKKTTKSKGPPLRVSVKQGIRGLLS